MDNIYREKKSIDLLFGNSKYEKWLSFNNDFNEPLTDEIIKDINKYENISFGSFFTQKIDNLPKSLKRLSLGCFFNEKINNLPDGLTHLILGENSTFNHDIDKLPLSLTHLRLGKYFNKKINNLPDGLTHLILGENFNKPLDFLPKNLKKLFIDFNYEHKLDNLPEGLEQLTFGYEDTINYGSVSFKYYVDEDDIDKCYHKFQHDLTNLPKSLKCIKILRNYKGKIILPKNCEIKYHSLNL